jgi:DNA-binding NarL/FixJ family response regulator
MKILLIDRHESFRDEFHFILQRLTNGMAEMLGADNCSQGLVCAGQGVDLDLVLLELNALESNGGDSVRVFRERHPSVPVVVVSPEEHSPSVQRALHNGASGCVGKNSPEAMLLDVLRLVLAGEVVVRPKLFQMLLSPKKYRLTDRQRQVLACLTEGLSNKEIAERFDLAEGTVKVHVAALCQALGVRGRKEAARMDRQLGLVARGFD